LATLQSIISDARSGDLTNRGEVVQPEAVEQWIRERWLDDSVERLLAEIEYGPAEAAAGRGTVHRQLRDAVLETLQHRHVMRIEGLAVAVGCSETELRTVLTTDPTAFGTLGTPAAIVFERIAPGS
jgi:predicted transcriptional regulator